MTINFTRIDQFLRCEVHFSEAICNFLWFVEYCDAGNRPSEYSARNLPPPLVLTLPHCITTISLYILKTPY